MSKTLMGIFFLCSSLVYAAESETKDSLLIGLGVGLSDALIQSQNIASAKVSGLGWRWSTDLTWQHKWLGYADFYIDSSWYHLDGNDAGIDYQLDIYAVKPVLRFYPDEAKQSVLFYEAALGVSYFTDKDFENIRLSSDSQFAMHFSLGWHLTESRDTQLTIGYHHFSNGYLDQPNQGLDFFLVDLMTHF